MDNKKIPTALGASVLVIIAVTASAFVWIYEENQGPLAIALAPLPQQIKGSDTATQKFSEMDRPEKDRLAELTKDWQTYRDEKYGYEFKYPKNYSVMEDKPNPEEKLTVVSSMEKYMPPMAGGCPNPPCNYPHISHEIIIETFKKPNNSSVEDIKKSLEMNIWDRSSGKNLLIDAKLAFYYSGGTYGDAIYIFGNEKTYLIHSDPGWGLPNFKNIFQGIYFTFREL